METTDFIKDFKPPEEIKEDGLPGGGDKGKNYRGTLAWWVINVLFAATVIASFFTVNNLKSQISDLKASVTACDEKAEKATERLIRKLENINEKVSDVEVKADSISEKVDNNETKYSKSLKTLKNAIR